MRSWINLSEEALKSILISFSAAGLSSPWRGHCAARLWRVSCQARPSTQLFRLIAESVQLACRLALKCFAAQTASKGMENAWQGLLQLGFKPRRTMLLLMLTNLTRRGTSLVPGFGTENVPKIGSVFLKAFLCLEIFSIEPPLLDAPTTAPQHHFPVHCGVRSACAPARVCWSGRGIDAARCPRHEHQNYRRQRQRKHQPLTLTQRRLQPQRQRQPQH